jgi:hypothetical protein
MVGLVVLAKLFSGPVQTGFHRGHAGIQRLGDFGMAAAFLNQGQEGAIVGPQLVQGVAEGVELLGIDGAGRLGHILVFRGKGKEDPPQLLAAEMVDAGVAGQPEQPGLELSGSLQPLQGPDHLDKNELGQILDRIAATRNGINKARDPVLVANDEIVLRPFLSPLGAADKFDQFGRFAWFHEQFIAVFPGKTPAGPERCAFSIG